MKKHIAIRYATVLSVLLLTSSIAQGCTQSHESTMSNVTLQEVTETDKSSQAEATSDCVTESNDLHPYEFTLCFAGDVSLADDAVTIAQMNASPNGIEDCISAQLRQTMRDADCMILNNEFTYSTAGAPLAGKAYTFRSNPEHVTILQELGVDAVCLANNHVYDYGEQALLDTFTTLEDAGIPYFGAGRNIQEATAPYYIEMQGKTIAIVAASRAEKNKMTPQATDDSPGILRCYDTTLFLEEIKEAKKHADFVIACVHWGTEYSEELEQVQIDTARDYIDAGADVIIGAHPHILQGMDYYHNAPIFYSLGNFWFNSKSLDTMLVTLRIYGDDNGYTIEPCITPALQANCTTAYLEVPEDRKAFYDHLMELSPNIVIDDNGIVQQP